MTRTLAFLLVAASACPAAELKPEAVKAYEKYIGETDARLAGTKPFLWADASPERLQKVKQGQIVVEAVPGKANVNVPGSLIHDYVGSVFIPGATIEKTLAVLQDYDHQKAIFRDTVDSKLISHNGNDFKYWRLRKLDKGRIKATIYTEYEAHYQQVDPTSWTQKTRSTLIQEVENPGKPNERKLPAGKDQGYLWRLAAFWRLQQRDNGVYLECEAISLTRDLPPLVGFLFQSTVNELENEGLTNTLQGTRDAIKK